MQIGKYHCFDMPESNVTLYQNCNPIYTDFRWFHRTVDLLWEPTDLKFSFNFVYSFKATHAALKEFLPPDCIIYLRQYTAMNS